MSDQQSDYQAFRGRLDVILRRKDPALLRDFLVSEGQWPEDATTDTEAALWMMIATSPALADQHDEAKQWLLSHGHETEARAIFGERRTGKSGGNRQHMRQQGKGRSPAATNAKRTDGKPPTLQRAARHPASPSPRTPDSGT